MYAIAFDMEIAELKKNSNEDGLGVVFDAMTALKQIDWFRKSVRDIRAFKVEDWSDFTQRIKS